MTGAFLSAVLLLAISAPAALAVDFLVPIGPGASLRETKAICTNNINQCWFITYIKPSESICGSDGITYGGECHLCFVILYENFNITKLHDGPCKKP